MGQGRRQQQRDQRLANDEEYRRQLGVQPGQALPNVIGEAHSGGAAKGGKPGARPRHKSRFGGKGKRDKPGPDITLTAQQVRIVKCPRCLAAVDAPCRNQHGRAVSAGHADRRRLAQRRLGNQRGSRTARGAQADPPLTAEELAERHAITQKAQLGRQPTVGDGRAVYSADAATSRVTRHRLRVDDGG